MNGYLSLFLYSVHHVAWGRAGLWQELRQSHLQVSHNTVFIPSERLRLTWNLWNFGSVLIISFYTLFTISCNEYDKMKSFTGV